MTNGSDAEIALAGWSPEQRDSLDFLLEDAGIRSRWQSDAVVVPSAAEEQARRLIEYLGVAGDSEHEAGRAHGGLVYPRFEATEHITIGDATPDDLFSFCFSDIDPPRAFAGLGEIGTVERDAIGRAKVTVSQDTRSGSVERVYQELDRARPGRLVALGSDSWGQVWRETWTFEPAGPDVLVSLTVDVEVSDSARTPDQMRSLRSDWSARRFAARRLGSMKTGYELGCTPDPQSL